MDPARQVTIPSPRYHDVTPPPRDDPAANPPSPRRAAAQDDTRLDLAPIPADLPPVPDMRRDAIEEAAETSPEARARIERLDTLEAGADPALRRPKGQSS